LFLMAATLALLGYAGSVIWGAVQTRMNAEPRTFAQRERVLAVNVVTVTPGVVTPELTVFGEVRSRRTLDLRAAVGGTVVEVAPAFVEGGTVRAGEVLLRIDPVEAEAALARVRTDLQDAEAEQRDATRALALAGDELAAAQAQAALRQQAMERQRDLLARGVGAAAALETAELAASSADQAVLARRQAVAQAETRLDQTETRLARAALSLAEAERALSETVIRAAFDATLAEVTVIPGGRVTSNERIAQLVDPGLLEVAFRVSTSQYATLLDGEGRLLQASVRAELDVSGLNLSADGIISREGATVGTGQTGRLIFAQLDRAPGLRPGDFVTVTVAEPAIDGVALLPATAVGADGGVLVVSEDDRLWLAPVEVLRRQGDNVIARPPDLDGAQVVAERSPLLGAGILVRPIVPGVASAAPEAAEMIPLDPDRRARLVAFVQGSSQMPADAKARLLSELEQETVSAEVVTRLERRMGS